VLSAHVGARRLEGVAVGPEVDVGDARGGWAGTRYIGVRTRADNPSPDNVGLSDVS